MKRNRFSEEQIIAILKEQEAGMATAEVCRRHGISSATFYKWKAKYGGLDISECANPRLTAEFKWPEPTHTITVSPNGKRVYGTVISPFTGDGGIEVMDNSDMAHPRFIGKFGATRPDGSSFQFATHEISISPNAGGIYVFDNSDLALGRADLKLRLIGTSQRAGWHSAVQARINGSPYLVGAGELGACPGSWPKITSLSDERNPRVVSEFKLAMNLKANCPPRTALESGSGGVLGRPGTASSHFNDVDSATNTRLGLFPFMYAGLRIVDLRDPVQPSEIAYFKLGDPCMSHARYVANTGQIWFACNESGFYVIELKRDVRALLMRKLGI